MDKHIPCVTTIGHRYRDKLNAIMRLGIFINNSFCIVRASVGHDEDAERVTRSLHICCRDTRLCSWLRCARAPSPAMQHLSYRLWGTLTVLSDALVPAYSKKMVACFRLSNKLSRPFSMQATANSISRRRASWLRSFAFFTSGAARPFRDDPGCEYSECLAHSPSPGSVSRSPTLPSPEALFRRFDLVRMHHRGSRLSASDSASWRFRICAIC